jgi:phosphatidylinositol alpha-1,6-mannosyltransferase
MKQCESRGIPAEKITVIPVGINFDRLDIYSELKRAEVVSKFNISMDKKKLLTVGRLVKRKGHLWFIANVFKKLPDNYIYIIVGVGPEHGAIKYLVHELDLTNRVYLLGQISEKEKNCLYQISDLFIMPNISVKGDQEGFGIVLLEAGGYGVPVIASNIEGIKDAVIDGKTGHLIEERDIQGFVDAIISTKVDRPSLKNTVIKNFNWGDITKRYYEEFEKMKAN